MQLLRLFTLLALVFVSAQALGQINLDPTQAHVSESKRFNRGGVLAQIPRLYNKLMNLLHVNYYPVRPWVFENLLVGLWVGAAGLSGAMLASALPYHYAHEEEIRCGSIGISFAAAKTLKLSLYVAVLLYLELRSSRMISRIGRHWFHQNSSRGRVTLFVGLGLWIAGMIVGSCVFYHLANQVLKAISSAPPLLSIYQTKATCQTRITEAIPVLAYLAGHGF